MKMISVDYKFMLIGAALLFAQGGAAMAGDITITPNKVTVEGPYTITQAAGQAFGEDAGISVSRRVSYADVDLTTRSGYDVMQNRIAGAASDVCRELDRRAPSDLADKRVCARTAAKNALRSVDVVVADLERALKVASAQ